MSTFALLFWFGGIVPAYNFYRSRCGYILPSFLNALLWPCALGYYVASRYIDDHE